jgi:hypothetical protein
MDYGIVMITWRKIDEQGELNTPFCNIRGFWLL